MQRRLFLILTSAQGSLIGGNLTMIGSALGAPWEINTQDFILFIEDVGEPPYKIDRLLQQHFGFVSIAGTAYVN